VGDVAVGEVFDAGDIHAGLGGCEVLSGTSRCDLMGVPMTSRQNLQENDVENVFSLYFPVRRARTKVKFGA